MKFYRLSVSSQRDGHAGYYWFTSLKEVEKAKREWKAREEPDQVQMDSYHTEYPITTSYGIEYELEVETISLRYLKKDILWVLNHYAAHPNNG